MAFGIQRDVLERTEHSISLGQGLQRVLVVWGWVSPGLHPHVLLTPMLMHPVSMHILRFLKETMR